MNGKSRLPVILVLFGILPAGLAAPEGAACPVGIVVADPDDDGDLVREAREPRVVLVLGGAGLARDAG